MSDGRKLEIYQYIRFFHGALQLHVPSKSVRLKNIRSCVHVHDTACNGMRCTKTVTALSSCNTCMCNSFATLKAIPNKLCVRPVVQPPRYAHTPCMRWWIATRSGLAALTFDLLTLEWCRMSATFQPILVLLHGQTCVKLTWCYNFDLTSEVTAHVGDVGHHIPSVYQV